jgi:polyribonucleotide nucleotidyltransferase
MLEGFSEEEVEEKGKLIKKYFGQAQKKAIRDLVLNEGIRLDGRGPKDIRAIWTEVDYLPGTHGSAIFTRGETQSLTTLTLGSKLDQQTIDTALSSTSERFLLHYNFPPFSTGEAYPIRGVSRREVGHGNLAQRALKRMIPPKDQCPYTVRLVSEILESNGSSSMASVCGSSLALMDAGVPLKKPVAGVAMGLIKDGEKFTILTDILGDEDHLGDMDFKVAGTTEGITAIQMDIKITGITEEIFTKAMSQAKEGRLHILGEMAKTIATQRPKFKEGVPQIKSTNIPKDKIGALIGPGGKNIKAIQEEHDVSIEITEEGEVKILGVDVAKLDEVITLVDMQINGPKIGSVYDAKVVTIKEYGAFVDIAAGISGLVHVSELADERVRDVNDYVSEGDTIKVKVLEVDRFGKIKLSAKAVESIKSKNPKSDKKEE